MAFVVIYDANVLYGNTLRDLLIRIAQAGMVQAKWTNQIMDEMLGNLAADRPDIPAEKLSRLRALTNAAVRDCLVEGHESLIEGLKLPDRTTDTSSQRPSKPVRRSSSHQISATFPHPTCKHGVWKRGHPMTSCSTRSTWTTGSFGPVSSRSSTPESTHRRRLRTSSMPWNEPDSSSPSPH